MAPALDVQHVSPALRTFCGDRALAALPRELDRSGLTRAVLVCGRSIVSRHPDILARLERVLGARLIARFDRVEAHSPLPSVEAAAELLAGSGADSVVSVGGGSAIVTSRAASILVAERKDARELATHRQSDGKLISPKLLEPKLAQWVVPTTPTTAYAKAGSAIRDPTTGERLAMYDPKLRARGIFIDPECALTAPPELVVGAALNSFSMAVEGLQSSTDDPLADALLMHALRLLVEWIPRISDDEQDAEPRMRLMLASLLSGQGTDYVGGGLAQALSHAAGPRSSTSNGVVETLLLAHIIRYNAPVTAERLRRVAQVLGAGSTDASPEKIAVDEVERILRSVRAPLRLSSAGVAREAIPEIAAQASEDWILTQVPRAADRDQLEELLYAAW